MKTSRNIQCEIDTGGPSIQVLVSHEVRRKGVVVEFRYEKLGQWHPVLERVNEL